MSETLNLDGLINPHPLDEVGSFINEVLRQDHEQLTTTNGVTYMRAIKIGDISIFLARFNGHDRNNFTVGIDSVDDDDECIPITDDFRWDIHNPEGADKDVIKNIGKLEEVVKLLSHIGIKDDEA